jgi:hypothetical protein
MMTTQTVHITVDEGCDFSNTFYYTDPTTNLPIDITNYTAKMMVRGPDFGSQEALAYNLSYNSATSTSTSGITLGGTAGTVVIAIPAADSLSGVWYNSAMATYDILLTSPAGVTTKFVKGFFTVIPSTTKLP